MSSSSKSLKEDLEEFLNKVIEFVDMAESAPDKCLDKDTCMHVYTTLEGYRELIENKARSLVYITDHDDRKRYLYEDIENWAHNLSFYPFEILLRFCGSAQPYSSQVTQVTNV